MCSHDYDSQHPTRFSYHAIEPSLDGESDPGETAHSIADMPPLTQKQTARLSLQFWLLWFMANWTLNASLEFTSVASSTVLASTSGFFTLIVTWSFEMERVSRLKVVGVFTSFLGVASVAYSDRSQALDVVGLLGAISVSKIVGTALFGDVLALSSAIFYALYVTLLKVRIQDESRINMPLFFGFVGLFNIFLAPPAYAFLHFTGIERMEWPNAERAWITILANMLITLSSDYLYVLAMLKTTPLVVTVGISLTIPFALIGDFLIATHPARQAILGAFLVLASFVAVGLPQASDDS